MESVCLKARNNYCLLTIFIVKTHLGFGGVGGAAAVLGRALRGGNSLLDKNGVLVAGANARRLDGRFVDVHGFLEDRGLAVVVVVAVDGEFVYADSFLEGRWGGAAGGCVDGGFFDADGLLEGSRAVMVVRVVGVAAVYNGLGDVHVLAVAGLVAGAVFTLDLVDRAEVLVVLVVPVVRRVVVVVPVRVDFNVRVHVR